MQWLLYCWGQFFSVFDEKGALFIFFSLFCSFLIFCRLFCVHVTNMLLSASPCSASSTYLCVHHKKDAKDEKRTKKVKKRWKGHLFRQKRKKSCPHQSNISWIVISIHLTLLKGNILKRSVEICCLMLLHLSYWNGV